LKGKAQCSKKVWKNLNLDLQDKDAFYLQAACAIPPADLRNAYGV
jgi:hypothetical protein